MWSVLAMPKHRLSGRGKEFSYDEVDEKIFVIINVTINIVINKK